MTLIKSKTLKGQAVLEYFILTIVLVAFLLFFGQTQIFTSLRGALDQMFNGAVNRITQ